MNHTNADDNQGEPTQEIYIKVEPKQSGVTLTTLIFPPPQMQETSAIRILQEYIGQIERRDAAREDASSVQIEILNLQHLTPNTIIPLMRQFAKLNQIAKTIATISNFTLILVVPASLLHISGIVEVTQAFASKNRAPNNATRTAYSVQEAMLLATNLKRAGHVNDSTMVGGEQ